MLPQINQKSTHFLPKSTPFSIIRKVPLTIKVIAVIAIFIAICIAYNYKFIVSNYKSLKSMIDLNKNPVPPVNIPNNSELTCNIYGNEFKVSVASENKATICQSLKKWNNIVDKKIDELKSSTDKTSKNKYQASKLILVYAERIFQAHRKCDTIKIITSYCNGKLESIGMLTTPLGMLSYVASNPENFEGETKKGAGSSIILFVAKHAMQSQANIVLSSGDNAKGFYQKLGFEDYDGRLNFMLDKNPMTLTSSKIKSLVDTNTTPFNQLAS